MPTFDCKIEIDFEVFCECGAHLCSETRISYKLEVPQVVIGACRKCQSAATSERERELESLIESLEWELKTIKGGK